MPFDGLRAVEAMQLDIGVSELQIDLVFRPVALVVEHQRAAEAGGVEPAVAEKVQHVAPAWRWRGGRRDRALALDASKGEIEDRAQHEVARNREVPAHSAGSQKARPLHRDHLLGLAVVHGESRVIAAVGQRTLEVQRYVPLGPAPATDRGLAKIGVAGALIRDRESARGDIRRQREAHQRENRVGAFLELGVADLRRRRRRSERAGNAQGAREDAGRTWVAHYAPRIAEARSTPVLYKRSSPYRPRL